MTSDPHFRRFMKESGFKVLALARLNQCGYSVMLYLLNCAVSGLDQFITTESELASLIGYDDDTLRSTLSDLAGKNIVRLHYGDTAHNGDAASMRIGIQYDTSKWILDYDVEITSQDAIVFPFRRQGTANIRVLEGHKKDHKLRKHEAEPATWQRVLESFVQQRSLDDDEVEQVEAEAKMLVETHPVDQVLLMLRHFRLRIPTLSLLASSWSHYQEIFEAETQKVDMLGARQKYLELDQKLRDQATARLEKNDNQITEEERTVLQIILKHRHPRRQLFWAYQLRSRYPNLAGFFADNASLMLPVTTGGTVVKKHD